MQTLGKIEFSVTRNKNKNIHIEEYQTRNCLHVLKMKRNEQNEAFNYIKYLKVDHLPTHR